MNGSTIRLIASAAIVWYVLSGGMPSVGPSAGPYTGSMGELHTAAAAMDPKDRAVLAEAMAAAGEMLAADQLGLVSTTEEVQRYIRACVEFEYLGMGKPTQKYPAVAKAFQDELMKTVGSDVAPVTATTRASIAAMLAEAGKAVR